MSEALYAFDAAFVEESIARGNAPLGPPLGPPLDAPLPRLCGADEAGRGAWAGPVAAAAVVLGERQVGRLGDSKRLSSSRREALFDEILTSASGVSVALLPAWWIDRHGLGAANRVALERAIGMLEGVSDCSLADGRLRLRGEIRSLPRADGSSAAVAAASIVAKVLRDRSMRRLAGEREGYGFERHVGYGTREHRLALAESGPCRVHRLSYNGVES